ncbi:MAG: MFS transporter [Candidatus Tectomicrobia bacterium]|nr:MFS transporter [Candidatus Tectomicrobia bacterium]
MKRTRTAILSIISLGHLDTHWNTGAFGLLSPFIAAEFGLSYAHIGVMSSVRFFISACVNLPGSALVDVLGKRTGSLMLALAVPSLGYLLLSLAPSIGIIMIAMGLLGFGASLWHPPAMSLLSSLMPDRRGFAMSTHEFGAGLGDLLSPLVFGLVLTFLSWRAAAALNILPGLLLALLVWFTISDRLGDSGPGKRLNLAEYRMALKKLIKHPVMLWLSAVSSLRTTAQQAIITLLPLYLAKEWHLSPKMIGVYLGSASIASLFAGPMMGALSDRIGRMTIMLTAFIISGLCSLLLVALGQGLAFLITLFFLGMFLFSVRPIIFAAALDATPEETGASVVGLIFSANQLLAAITPIFAGFLADRYGGVALFYFAGISLLLGAVSALFVIKPIALRPALPATAAEKPL